MIGEEWRELFWKLAKVLKCLPSTYVDGNEHVFKSAEDAMQAKVYTSPIASSEATALDFTRPLSPSEVVLTPDSQLVEEIEAYQKAEYTSCCMEEYAGRKLLEKIKAALQVASGEAIGHTRPSNPLDLTPPQDGEKK